MLGKNYDFFWRHLYWLIIFSVNPMERCVEPIPIVVLRFVLKENVGYNFMYNIHIFFSVIPMEVVV